MWKIQCFDKNGEVIYDLLTPFPTPHDVMAYSPNQEVIQQSARIELTRVDPAE